MTMFRAALAATAIFAGLATTASAQSADARNVLYMDIKCGRVTIEMRPDLAPRTVAQIRALTRDNFFDGLMFFGVVPGSIVKTGDPYNQGIGKSDYDNLPNEFSSEPFVRGAVGMLREPMDTGEANSQFFILEADQPELNGQLTYWGKVIDGMDCVDQIGAAPWDAWFIEAVRVAFDVGG